MSLLRHLIVGRVNARRRLFNLAVGDLGQAGSNRAGRSIPAPFDRELIALVTYTCESGIDAILSRDEKEPKAREEESKIVRG